MKPKISIIIPTYKPSSFFEECLNSISEQTYGNFELIIVLNGCREPFYSTILGWINKLNLSTQSTIIQVPESGVSTARNVGIEKSKGEFITFIDDDDLISRDYLEELIRCSGDDSTLVVSNVLLYPIEKFKDVDYGPAAAYEKLHRYGFRNFIEVRQILNGPWMKLFPRRMIGDTRFDKYISLGEDAIFCFELSTKIKNINTTSSQTYYYYRLVNGGVSWSNKSVWFYFSNMFRILWKYCTIYFSSPLNYNFGLFVNRILATLWSFLHRIIRVKRSYYIW